MEIQHNLLHEVSKQRDLTDKTLKLKEHRHLKWSAAMKVVPVVEWLPHSTWRSQNDILSPEYFHLVCEMIARSIGEEEDVKGNAVHLNSIGYADDADMISASEKDTDFSDLLTTSEKSSLEKPKVLVKSMDEDFQTIRPAMAFIFSAQQFC